MNEVYVSIYVVTVTLCKINYIYFVLAASRINLIYN